MTDLSEKLERIARAPRLLVACDFDGTLTPIAPRPALARIERETLDLLGDLAALPQTNVAVVSGRSRTDLAAIARWPTAVRLVGSHGLEHNELEPLRLSPDQLSLREQLVIDFRAIAAADDSFVLEEKPAGVAFHFRLASKSAVEKALAEIQRRTAGLDGLFPKAGDRLLEYFVIPANKGTALSVLRFETGASATLFVGDDITDEDGFAAMTSEDLGIKVGDGDTTAPHRVRNPEEVHALLMSLCKRRGEHLAARDAAPLERHSILSDQRTLAIVTDRGRIVWMCAPRLDSMPLFAEMVGGPNNGFWDVEPLDSIGLPRQSYAGDTLTLVTTWPQVLVTDFLDCSEGRPFQRAGRTDLVRVIEGAGRVRVRFVPRLNFGRTSTRMSRIENGLRVEGTPDPIVLRSTGVNWKLMSQGVHHSAETEIELRGDPVVLELRYGTGSLGSSNASDAERRRQTEHHWKAWVATLRIPPLRPDLVRRSALLLRSLCYRPTGAIAAAGTTSLPEWPGGSRNWDYRYCWLRDGALAASSLVRLGSTGQALRFLDWLIGVLERCDSPESLRPLYTVSGGHLGPEAEISELDGWMASKPVRIGNAAADQIQLDVFGPITDLIALLAQTGAPVTPEHWRLTEAMVAAVERRWMSPDSGIWEIRLPPRHHLHSKVMCWVTLDRAQRIAQLYLGCDRPEWRAVQRSIEQDILTHGFHPAPNSFTSDYGRDQVDAAVLQVGLCGLLPPNDPRFISTVNAVERILLAEKGVFRYRYPDGLPGREGVFHLCTSWLVQAYARIGRHREARKLFDVLADQCGPTGVLTEEADPSTGAGWGNLPQAYSHLGLIDAAVALCDHEGS